MASISIPDLGVVFVVIPGVPALDIPVVPLFIREVILDEIGMEDTGFIDAFDDGLFIDAGNVEEITVELMDDEEEEEEEEEDGTN